MPCQPWWLPSSHGHHSAQFPAPLHMTIHQHSGRLLSALALGVGHHGSHCWPFRSRCFDGRCELVVIYIGISRVLYQVIGNNLPTRWRWTSSSAPEPLARQLPCQIGCCATLSRQQHHWGMMRVVGGGEIGGIRPGDDFFDTMGLLALIDHGSCCWPTATMRPNSRHQSTQQSANMLGDRFLSLKLGKIIVNYVH